MTDTDAGASCSLRKRALPARCSNWPTAMADASVPCVLAERPSRSAGGLRTREAAAAWLHVVTGIFVCACVSVLWVSAALLAPSFEGSFVPGLVAMFGRPVAVVLLVLSSVQWVAAVALLRGSAGARRVLLGISLLLLPIFPIGTAVALYSAWAFLHKQTTEAQAGHDR